MHVAKEPLRCSLTRAHSKEKTLRPSCVKLRCAGIRLKTDINMRTSLRLIDGNVSHRTCTQSLSKLSQKSALVGNFPGLATLFGRYIGQQIQPSVQMGT